MKERNMRNHEKTCLWILHENNTFFKNWRQRGVFCRGKPSTRRSQTDARGDPPSPRLPHAPAGYAARSVGAKDAVRDARAGPAPSAAPAGPRPPDQKKPRAPKGTVRPVLNYLSLVCRAAGKRSGGWGASQ